MGEWQVKRKQVHQHYTDSFTNLPLRIIQPSEHCESNYHKFALLTDNRDGLKSFLHEKGIQAIEHYTDNFAEFIGSDKSFPNTEMFCEQVLTLPNHPWLTDAEVEIVADAVKDFYK